MSNLGFFKAMEEKDIAVIATAVGDRYVLEKMLAEDHQLVGEQSGHVIMRKFSNTGDGVLTALQLMQVMATTGESLKDLASIMKRFPQVLINVKDIDKTKLSTSQAIGNAIDAKSNELGDRGRILVRSSGTESLVRVMVEAESHSEASEIATEIAEIVRSELRPTTE